MKQYFKNHPVINYDGLQLRNLMVNSQLTREVLGETTTFLPYTVQEGDTPTTVAFDYYGHVDYTWLVLLSNSIIDPYTQWPKTQEQFHNSLIQQYGSVEATYPVIHHYQHQDDPTHPPVTPTTYQFMNPTETGNLRPVYLYDYLNQLNEAKRSIRLVDRVYAARISLELEKKLMS